MTSKTFETAHADNKSLKVDKLFGNPRLLIKEFNGDTRGFAFAPSDAPALALAILEAAGWPNEYLATTEILRRLRELDEHAKAVEAEARELAELEAEALELANAAVIECGNPPYPSVERMGEKVLRRWLAVARRARELAKEATK